MSQIHLADAMNALAALFAAATPLAGVTIELGPTPSAAGDLQFVLVGHDGALESDGSLSEIAISGQVTKTFTSMGAPPVEGVTGTVNCVAVCQSGDQTALATCITTAEAMVGACDDALVDQTVATANGKIVFDQVTTARLITREGGQGCVAQYTFAATFTAPW